MGTTITALLFYLYFGSIFIGLSWRLNDRQARISTRTPRSSFALVRNGREPVLSLKIQLSAVVLFKFLNSDVVDGEFLVEK